MREPMVKPISIRNIIFAAKRSLEAQNLVPKQIHASTLAYLYLLEEISLADKKKHVAILDVFGIPVSVDPDCPSMGAYVVGEDSKDYEKESEGQKESQSTEGLR